MSILVEATGLSKKYRVGPSIISAVEDVSISIASGEFLAIVGRSGSGKSTLMNLLGLLEQPDEGGRYNLKGNEVGGLSEEARAGIRARQIGFVFQLPALLPRASALENVELPLAYCGIAGHRSRRLAAEALERVGLAGRVNHWPHQLSGGEQQRVAIARAIVNEPDLVLADEPTGALDSTTSRQILALFDTLNREKRTIVVVTHSSDVADAARRRITLHDGRIVRDEGAGALQSAMTSADGHE
jgi:putative ABC transport system ATP-binding protein